ncbi:hypothetical protein T484DRAFT_1812566, partial [Baffinella frigidus]
FGDCELEQLVKHALTALKEEQLVTHVPTALKEPSTSLDDAINATKAHETSQNGDINALNASVSIVGIGPDETFKVYDGEDVQKYIDLLDK